MNDLESLFIQHYSLLRLNSWEEIAKYEKKDVNEVKKLYTNLERYFGYKLGVPEEEIKSLFSRLKPQIDEIQNIFQKFTNKRKEGFQEFANFNKWYQDQNKECYYCKTSEENLKRLFDSNHGLFKPKKTAWSKGALQIERLNPDAGYTKENCRLACVFCNNAKSDLISSDDFKEYFANPMNRYLSNKIKQLNSE